MRTVLSVAFPFAPVGPDATGGAEQVLSAIDAALVAAGHRSLVVACDGSRTAGRLVALPRVRDPIDDRAREDVHAACRRAIASVLRDERVDVVHLHGLDFAAYLPPPGPPVLVTLHLPPSFYAADGLRVTRPRTFLHCVSATQRAACPPSLALLPDVPNGVAVERFRPRATKHRYVLALGRICPEKGFDEALDAAALARTPIVLGGEVHPYAAHRAYFRDAIVPRLGPGRLFAGPLSFSRKRRLLAGARCLLVPSKAQETSSLVAMEALASGTPVVAYRVGALPDIVEHGVTGFLVDGIDAMATAIGDASRLDPAACRRVAERRFSGAAMTAAYLATYDAIA